MSISIVSPDEMKQHREMNWRLIEPGFLVDVANFKKPYTWKYALVKEKIEPRKLAVILLTQENIFSLLHGNVPKPKIISSDSVLNVHATSVTDAMCHERDGLTAHCRTCSNAVYKWTAHRKGTQNYRVDAQGFCRHIDCFDLQKSESSA